jgi:hypothetical protein
MMKFACDADRLVAHPVEFLNERSAGVVVEPSAARDAFGIVHARGRGDERHQVDAVDD